MFSLTVYSRVTKAVERTGATGDERAAILIKVIEGLSEDDRKLLGEQTHLVVELTGEYKDRKQDIAVMEELYA